MKFPHCGTVAMVHLKSIAIPLTEIVCQFDGKHKRLSDVGSVAGNAGKDSTVKVCS